MMCCCSDHPCLFPDLGSFQVLALSPQPLFFFQFGGGGGGGGGGGSGDFVGLLACFPITLILLPTHHKLFDIGRAMILWKTIGKALLRRVVLIIHYFVALHTPSTRLRTHDD